MNLEALVYLPLWAMILLPLGAFVVGAFLATVFWGQKKNPDKETPIYKVEKNSPKTGETVATKTAKATTKRIR